MSETKLLNITNDYIFKRTFGYAESGEVTKILLRDILLDDVNSIILTDMLEIVIIELPKYMKYMKEEKRKNLNLWLKFFENPEVVIMLNEDDEKNIKETKEAIKKAQDNLEKISKDEHERYLAELREKYIRDQVAVQEYGYYKGKEEGIEEGRQEGIEKGRKEGIQEGREEAKTEIIKTMVKNGITISQIADMLKIKTSEIEEMLK